MFALRGVDALLSTRDVVDLVRGGPRAWRSTGRAGPALSTLFLRDGNIRKVRGSLRLLDGKKLGEKMAFYLSMLFLFVFACVCLRVFGPA